MNTTSENSTICINVPTATKKEAARILNEMGMNMSSAVNVFLTQVIKQNAIPFRVVNYKLDLDAPESLCSDFQEDLGDDF